MAQPALTAVVDIGKTHARLLLMGPDGVPAGAWRTACRTVDCALGYRALDSAALEAWLHDTLSGAGELRAGLRNVIVTTHGAALAGLAGGQLAMPVPDYEFTGFDDHGADWPAQLDPFERTLSPSLPRGLNLATQLDWLQRHCPGRFAAVDTWLPYAQYWAWWLSGVAASEVSSLGCHTQLWLPREGRFAPLAVRRGWAAHFAPLRRAWETLGTLRPELAQRLGLPAGVQVHCGVHDSNACLARYLRAWPRMTLVSTGTWVVVMAPGTPAPDLDAQRDFMANVSVRGEAVPTGRFMGGREVETLCAGADPTLADPQALQALLREDVHVLPGLGALGGPFADRSGGVRHGNRRIALQDLAQHFDAADRATLAALHCAYTTAWIIAHLGASGPVAVDGPLATNPVYCQALSALMPRGSVHASVDPVEGTARGSWVLSQWTSQADLPPEVLAADPGPLADLIRAHHQRWLGTLAVTA